ncbi:MAG: hypothetical protein K2W95_05150 [Candidatus Obscuribacterales bacterium]|nr:hypothetical protein [Candidatus Obscuribacterales bacterium]
MKFKSASIVAVLSCLASAPSALAIDYMDLLRGYVGGPTSGGRIAPQTDALIKTNINTRQAQLETEVQAGVRSGQLTPQEESELRAELNRIAAQEGAALSDGSLTTWEVQSLLNDMQSFSRRLEAYLTNADVAANTSNPWSRNTYNSWRGRNSDDAINNQVQLQASIDTRQAALDSQIEQSLSAGILTWQQARTFETELNQIAAKETTFTADGRLSYRETNELLADLDTLDGKVKAHIANYDRNRRDWGRNRNRGRGNHRNYNSTQSVLRQRIDFGLRSGRLTRVEANRLIRDEQRIADLEAQMRLSGGRLSYSEQRRLLTELDNLSRNITRELNDHQVQYQ